MKTIILTSLITLALTSCSNCKTCNHDHSQCSAEQTEQCTDSSCQESFAVEESDTAVTAECDGHTHIH